MQIGAVRNEAQGSSNKSYSEENSQMINDKRRRFKDKDGVKAFFPLLPVDTWSEMPKPLQRKLIGWRKLITCECASRDMKNTFTDIIKKMQSKN